MNKKKRKLRTWLVEIERDVRECESVEVEAAGGDPRPGDIPIYVSDCSHLAELTDWQPQISALETLADTLSWIEEHEADVLPVLAA